VIFAVMMSFHRLTREWLLAKFTFFTAHCTFRQLACLFLCASYHL